MNVEEEEEEENSAMELCCYSLSMDTLTLCIANKPSSSSFLLLLTLTPGHTKTGSFAPLPRPPSFPAHTHTRLTVA